MICVRQILFMTAAVLALLAVGCAKEESPARGWDSDPDAVRVEASVGAITRTNPLGGEDSDKFSVGDKIAISNGTKTVKYQFDGISWAPEADENGTTDYLVWDTPVTFRAWYPASRLHDGTEFMLPSIQNQTGSGDFTLANADYMASDAYNYSSSGDIPGDRTFKPELKRRMALVTVIIDKVADEFDDVKDIKVQVKSIFSAQYSVNLQSDGTFKSEGGAIEVFPYSHDIDGKSAYSAVVVPDAAAAESKFLNISVDGYTDDAKTNQYSQLKEVTGIPAAEAGKHYTYKLIVGKETVKIGGVTVEDWTAGTKFDGKFEAEVDNYSEWDGKKITSTYYFSGYGTSESPYLIKSAADLAGLAANVNAGTNYQGSYFKLETNIDLMGREWTPIGNKGRPFKGIFNGNNKIITNMAITAAPSDQSAGLFGNCSSASVSNVVLKNAKITYSGEAVISAGLICGVFSGTVKNCRVEGAISTTNGKSGGIIGEVSVGSTSVLDCEVEMQCENGWDKAGGIVGSAMLEWVPLTIERCTVKGEINGGNDYFGGIAGSLSGHEVLVKDCTSYVKLGWSTGGTHPKVGGLVGSLTYGKAESCTVYGSISFTYSSCSVGGMFSEVYDVKLSNLNFSGDIDVTIQGETVMPTYIGAYIAWINATGTTATGCTYKKSGTGDYPVVGHCAEESFDTSKLDIKGI